MEVIKTILTVVCTGGLFAFLEFLIRRRDEKKGAMSKVLSRLDGIETKQNISEKDSCRTQLLILLNHYPKNVPEVLKLAEHYFRDLHGDWYMTSLFNAWLVQNGIGKPEWFASGQ